MKKARRILAGLIVLLLIAYNVYGYQQFMFRYPSVAKKEMSMLPMMIWLMDNAALLILSLRMFFGRSPIKSQTKQWFAVLYIFAPYPHFMSLYGALNSLLTGTRLMYFGYEWMLTFLRIGLFCFALFVLMKSPKTVSVEISDALANYRTMLEQGVITRQEFEEMAQRIQAGQ